MTARALLAVAALLAGLACGKDEVVCHGSRCAPCGPGGCPSAAGVIHRSVGFGSTAALAVGDANPMRIAGGVATFDEPLPGRIGVGDALVSTSGTTSSIAFVTRRRSATAYELQTGEGEPPPDVPTPTLHWALFRAYASLGDAADRTPNPGIPAALRDFDAATDGKDLVATGKIWSIACYADAPDATPDTRAVFFEGWTTDPDHYLRIHAPSSSSEVGESQRHHGAFDATRYQLRKSVDRDDSWHGVITLSVQYARVEGLQLVDQAADSPDTLLFVGVAGQGEVRVEGNLLLANRANAQATTGVVFYGPQVTVPFQLSFYDNVVSGLAGGFLANFEGESTTGVALLYSNTFYDCGYGIQPGTARLVAVNDLFGAMATACVGGPIPLDAASDHNLCSTSETMTGVHSSSGVSAQWVDPAAWDFHLSPADTAAVGKGADLSSDPYLPFQVDFEGQLRAGRWDVGADQR